MLVFSITLLAVNAMFLLLGGVLSLYIGQLGIKVAPDDLFPYVVQNYLPFGVFVIFIVGLISALFPSVDGAITALTSSFCIDVLGFNRNNFEEEKKKRVKRWIHLSFALLFMILVFLFKWLDNKSIVDLIFDIAGYTYGPLLGLFAFGILTKRQFIHPKIAVISLVAPLLCYIIKTYATSLLGTYQIGNELLILNGTITFILLFIFSKKTHHVATH
jgi:Na+/proline symporter